MARSSLRGYNKNGGSNNNQKNGDNSNSSNNNSNGGDEYDMFKNFSGADFNEAGFNEDAPEQANYKGVDGAKEFLSQNENKSEDELMGDLKSMIDSGKADGSFSKEMLDNFYNMAAPMMQGEQKEKLDSLVNMIKDDKL